MSDSKLEIVVSEVPNKAIKGILNVFMENFPRSETGFGYASFYRFVEVWTDKWSGIC